MDGILVELFPLLADGDMSCDFDYNVWQGTFRGPDSIRYYRFWI